MENENKLRGALLRQNGIDAERLSEEEQKELYRMIDLEERRITRMKWATAICWVLLFLLHIVWPLLPAPQGRAVMTSVSNGQISAFAYLGMIMIILYPTAIICTISLLFRLYKMRGLRQRQILKVLSTIEERLRHLEEKK